MIGTCSDFFDDTLTCRQMLINLGHEWITELPQHGAVSASHAGKIAKK